MLNSTISTIRIRQTGHIKVKAKAATKVEEYIATTTFRTFKEIALRETALKKVDITRSATYTEI